MKHNFRQSLALHHLNNGVIAHPTDTIYGIACLAKNSFALSQMINLKKRTLTKGFILLASDIDYVLPYIDPNFASNLLDRAQMTKNTPTTFLVPANPSTPKILTGGGPFVAVRLTANFLIKFFCENSNSALVSTSANTQGQNTALSLLQLRRQFKNGLSFALPPNKNRNQASVIINLVNGERIR